jgi:hypothetical protein
MAAPAFGHGYTMEAWKSMAKAWPKHGEAGNEAAVRVQRHSTFATDNPRSGGSGIWVLKGGWGMWHRSTTIGTLHKTLVASA